MMLHPGCSPGARSGAVRFKPLSRLPAKCRHSDSGTNVFMSRFCGRFTFGSAEATPLAGSGARLCTSDRIDGGSQVPAKSAAQQKAAGAALSAKRGETPKSKLKGASKSMALSMSEKELEKMTSTSRKGKPEHKAKK